ncbi:Wiskott-Aldrich syndrome protein family member 2 [Eufriesea mexicana]|uniref:Wiskott-Aldrich syndrome protein family member 2 n=1 Tax=Eufriesea mexicana TaxID=516756 RepID=A0A310SFU6_9HYME|nr:Wiskott-Aldrich syndrome protein family member 2 [Eufriesea mexicana]
MPFVLRRVEPRFLCRGHVPAGSSSQGWPVGAELEAVANGALTTSLKQLATLLTTAEDIFAELTAELTAVADRSSSLRQRLDKVEERLASVDPKKVPVLTAGGVTAAACCDAERTAYRPRARRRKKRPTASIGKQLRLLPTVRAPNPEGSLESSPTGLSGRVFSDLPWNRGAGCLRGQLTRQIDSLRNSQVTLLASREAGNCHDAPDTVKVPGTSADTPGW